MIAAHPDDENTALLAYFARGRKVRTGYLSLTRGEGGQNLIGPEQGDALGVIRTQELLAARKIDGAEQFFTRAIDFGFTKTAQETFEKWGHDKILSDVVWVIRRFQPDVIVLRFTGTPRDGHGQHQVSALLGKEAFSAAADPKQFPEQLQWVQPWQAKRIFWNTFAFTRQQEEEAAKIPNQIAIDLGTYDPVLGHSYAEIAGMSRSMHRSQGMGAPERRGSSKNYLALVAGEPATKDAFENIDTTWNRIPGGASVGKILAQAAHDFDIEHPEKSVPALLKAKKDMAGLHQPVVEPKQRDLDEAIALCSGLWLDAVADKYAVTPGGSLKISATALDRSPLAVGVESVDIDGAAKASTDLKHDSPLAFNEPHVSTLTVSIPANEPYSQPYWLREPKQGETYTVPDQLDIGLAENPPLLNAHFHLVVAGEKVEVIRHVAYRYIERSQGELTRPVIVEPEIALRLAEGARIFPNAAARSIDLQVEANVAEAAGLVQIHVPDAWSKEPQSRDFKLSGVGQQSELSFQVSPPAAHDSQGELTASATVGGRNIAVGMQVIHYPHIPIQVLFPPSQTKLVRSDIGLSAKTIGYIMGAGDEVPEALRQLGADVVVLNADDLARCDLRRFDAVVTGVRAYNTRPDLRANQARLLEYVKNGGTMIVQYNVLDGGFVGGDPASVASIGPYPIKIGRDRVTVEEAPVEMLTTNALLEKPNKITSKDFEGWVQERGLYFASEWDSHYQPLFETHDPGDKPLRGGTLYTKYGKGVYIFTAFSWFRELPSGVPGAYRIFANFLSAGKTE